jgi:hypothetical protein
MLVACIVAAGVRRTCGSWTMSIEAFRFWCEWRRSEERATSHSATTSWRAPNFVHCRETGAPAIRSMADVVDRTGLDLMKPKRQSLNSTTPPNKEAKLSRPSGRRSIARARESDERMVFLRAPGQQSGLKIKLPRGDSGHGTRWQFLLMPRLCDERTRHLQAPRVHAGAAGEEMWGRLNPRPARARGWSWRAAIIVGSHVRLPQATPTASSTVSSAM